VNQYYTVTYVPIGLAVTDSVYHVIAHAIQGAVAGLIYKTWTWHVIRN